MFVVKATHFRSATTAAVIRDVRCEKCGCAYRYELVRRGEGMGSAVYGIAEGAAERRADQRAQALLEEHLANAIDPVACPVCGWYQAAMVREFQGWHCRWLATTGMIIRWIAGAVLFVLLANWIGDLLTRHTEPLPPAFWVAVTVTAACFLLGIAIGRILCPMLRRRIDLNAHYPEKPVPIPGMPSAFRRGEERAAPSGEATEFPAAGNAGSTVEYARPHPQSPGGWVWVQLLTARFPGACCWCLRSTEFSESYHPLWSKTAKVTVPLCHSCTDRFWGRRGLCAMAIILFFAGAFAGLGAWSMGSGILWLGAGVGAVWGWMVSNIFTPMLIRPVDLRRFSSERNTIQLRFRNRVYNTAFADANQAPPN